MRTIIVIAAHLDDEILGCGGTIAKQAAVGSKVHVVIMAEGSTSRSPQQDVELHREKVRHLADVAKEANRFLGAASVTLHGLQDNRMDSLELLDVIKIVEGEIARTKPDVVLTHHSGELNIDHRIIHECVLTACRPQPGHTTKRILLFEVLSSTEWRPASSSSGESILYQTFPEAIMLESLRLDDLKDRRSNRIGAFLF